MIKTATDQARSICKNFKIGICGEYGGNPSSIHFFDKIGLDYVSCSPLRIPIARLESGKAVAIKSDVKLVYDSSAE